MRKAHTSAVLWLAIVLACYACVFALDRTLDLSQYAHTAWSERDGFTRDEINALAQTPDGYLWLGTELGLVRVAGDRRTLRE